MNLAETLKRLSEIGYDSIEVCLEHPDLNPLNPESVNGAGLKSLLERCHLKASAVSFHGKRSSWEERESISKSCLELCVALGVEIVIIGSILGRTEANFQAMADFTRELCIEAKSRQVLIAVEPEPETVIHGRAEMDRLLETVAADNLKVNLDIGHAFLIEPDLTSDILHWGGLIVHTHIEDMKDDEHRHLLPGKGQIDFSAVFQAFQKIEYEGCYTIDLFDITSDPLYYAREAYHRFREKVT
ncbi:sugar phosphate isomerase/epimerase [bacterium]|nr:sugar phosphate isomerase/epimerase [bacterium]